MFERNNTEDWKLVPFSLRELDASTQFYPFKFCGQRSHRSDCVNECGFKCISANTLMSLITHRQPLETPSGIIENSVKSFPASHSSSSLSMRCAHATQLIHNSRTHFKKRQQRQIVLAKLIGWQTLFHFQHNKRKKKNRNWLQENFAFAVNET